MAYSWQRRGTSDDDIDLEEDMPISQMTFNHDDMHHGRNFSNGRTYRPSSRAQGFISASQLSDDPVSLDYLDATQPQLSYRPADSSLVYSRAVDPPLNRLESARPLLSHSQMTLQQQSDTPSINGISLISTNVLPDRFRNIFPYPLLNAVQSKCFPQVYNTDDNFVLSSPTGSGKTVILELAILRLINTSMDGTFKIVYQAPTKSLCSERYRDWHQKFAALNLQVAELTGDVQNAQLRNVQHAELIITTPEKWDSITRKWKDHRKLMQMVKLFLIDEVHTLKEDRGAVLEIVVSRMKSVGSNIRFIALSATIPNIKDISAWLGRSETRQDVPALQETFGEEFRPVRIVKHICGYASKGNDFAFDKMLNTKIPEVITKYSQGKPILVFCFTRTACLDTAKALTEWWTSNRLAWKANSSLLTYENIDLQETSKAGVAFHHAGLSPADRSSIEKAYIAGDINVICCTSTLAAGVNLPCHMVIIKNTVCYAHATSTGCKEYSDLEIVQMLGRAGRPQFGDSAIAVIMTRQQKALYYERLVSGQETIESRLHLNLIDHLNAEIGLHTIHDDASATSWLCSTFLYIRLLQNPEHYKLNTDQFRRLKDHLNTICMNGIALLQEHKLVEGHTELSSTPLGDAMSRYCVQFETMQTLLALKRGAGVADILKAISQAAEFKEVYFRSGEKTLYRQWDTNPLIKHPLKLHIDARWHKVYLIVQVVLAGNELINAHREHRQDFNLSKNYIFSHAQRLIRCVCECMVHLQDGTGLRNALTLARSLAAQIWDDSTLHMVQLEGLGIAGVRKLVKADIRSIEDISKLESHRLEQIMSRHPPFGTQLQEKARAFPRLSIVMTIVGEPVIEHSEHVAIQVSINLAFKNRISPTSPQQRSVQLCLLVDDGQGNLLHFARISGNHIMREPHTLVKLSLSVYTDCINAQVSCEKQAGTAVTSAIKSTISRDTFAKANIRTSRSVMGVTAHTCSSSAYLSQQAPSQGFDDFDDDVEDQDLVQSEAVGVLDLTEVVQGQPAEDKDETDQPARLENGKWACRHACKDKTSCKHLCCREGLDKRPKPLKVASSHKEDRSDKKQGLQQSQLKLPRKRSADTGAQIASPSLSVITSTKQQASHNIAKVRRTTSTQRGNIDHVTPSHRDADSEPSMTTEMSNDLTLALDSPQERQAASLHPAASTKDGQDTGNEVFSSQMPAAIPPQPAARSYAESLAIVRAFLGDEFFTYET